MDSTYVGLEVFEAQFERFSFEHSWIGARVGELMLGPRGGGMLEFQHAVVFALPEGGAFEVHGDILAWYLEHGGPAAMLGYPLANQRRTPTGHGVYSVFEGGTVGWLPGTGAFLMGSARTA